MAKQWFTPLVLAAGLAAQDRVLTDADLPSRAKAAELLREALADDDPGALGDALQAATSALPEGSRARRRLEVASSAPVTRLRLEAGDVLADLTFEPLIQAPLPEGFPRFKAVGEVELRNYPGSRMVRTSMQRGGSVAAFWPLFRHIESNGIAMTTPVQMDWQADTEPGPGRQGAETMAFLYGDPTTGSTGAEGTVEVVDLPAKTVLSIGAVGRASASRVAELRDVLLRAANAHPEWGATGELRTMSYNSPMVPADRSYFEVQVVVEPRPVREDG